MKLSKLLHQGQVEREFICKLYEQSCVWLKSVDRRINPRLYPCRRCSGGIWGKWMVLVAIESLQRKCFQKKMILPFTNMFSGEIQYLNMHQKYPMLFFSRARTLNRYFHHMQCVHQTDSFLLVVYDLSLSHRMLNFPIQHTVPFRAGVGYRL